MAGGGSRRSSCIRNALANSQTVELGKFLCNGYPDGRGPVTFRRYTGQETDDQREEIRSHPPDILLTNYVMLEYILTRPFDQALVPAAEGLAYLVLDELHTYRGRQGSESRCWCGGSATRVARRRCGALGRRRRWPGRAHMPSSGRRWRAWRPDCSGPPWNPRR
jgi:hypothetical protein